MTPTDLSRPLPDKIELAEERVRLGKRLVDRGGIRVASRTELVEEAVQASLSEQVVDVERVPVGRFVEAAEAPRTEVTAEGEVTILPVYEERIVTETRLFLVEEVHLRRRAVAREVEIPVERRRQVAEVTRLPPLDDATTTQTGAYAMSDYSSSTGSGTGSTMSSRTVTALFDSSAEAERAVERLRRAGVPDSSIRVTAGGSTTETSMSGTSDQSTYSDQHRGFWDGLADFFFPDEDRYAYAEGLSRGAQLVTVSNFDASMHDTIVDILDDEGSVDLDARESEWRSSGSYTDYRSSDYYNEDEYSRTHRSSGMGAGIGSGVVAAGTAAVDAAGRAAGTVGAAVDNAMGGAGSRGTINDDGLTDRGAMASGDLGTAGTGTTGVAMSDTDARTGTGSDYGSDLADNGTVKVVEEQLSVGKRQAEAGRVRVRSYVREVPVEAEVDLRATRVFVDRRPVDRAVGAGDVSFQDRTIEARESAEEAVVAKEARVVEEIGLRQQTEVHTETVHDTVRKTEVEIEDERTGDVTRISGDDTTGRT